MAIAPEVEVVTTPNAGGSGGQQWIVPVLLIGGIALGVYAAEKSGYLQKILPGVSLHGIISGTAYSAMPVKACGIVAANVTIFNDTDATKTYTLYGDILPQGQTTAGSAAGHFWSSLTGISAHTPYKGVAVTVPAVSSKTVSLQAGRFNTPGPYNVLWILQVGGTTVTTRVDTQAVTTAFSGSQKCQLL